MKSLGRKTVSLLAGGLIMFGSLSLLLPHAQNSDDVSGHLVDNAYAATVDAICDCAVDSTIICHLHKKKFGGGGKDKDKDDGGDAHTIRVGEDAVPAHLAHGDSLGYCPGDDKDDIEVHYDRPCTCADGSPGNLVDNPPESMKSIRQVHGE